MKRAKKLTKRPDHSLSNLANNNRGTYGSHYETKTVNTGAILTSYMMRNITVKKLKEEAEVVHENEIQRRNKEMTEILESVFADFTRQNETDQQLSAFDFMNEPPKVNP